MKDRPELRVIMGDEFPDTPNRFASGGFHAARSRNFERRLEIVPPSNIIPIRIKAPSFLSRLVSAVIRQF